MHCLRPSAQACVYLLNSRVAGEHVSEHFWVVHDILHHGVVHHLTHGLLHLFWVDVAHSSETLSACQ